MPVAMGGVLADVLMRDAEAAVRFSGFPIAARPDRLRSAVHAG